MSAPERRLNKLIQQLSPRVATAHAAVASQADSDVVQSATCVDVESAHTGACEQACNTCTKSCHDASVGVNFNAWIPVATCETVKPKDVREAVLLGESICYWRGTDGRLNAVEDRCAHRMLRLSKGSVDGTTVTCCYHGWEYDGSGKVVKVAHEIPKSFKTLPDIKVRAYPIREQYNLVWIFAGDSALADRTPLPALKWSTDTVVRRVFAERVPVNHTVLLDQVTSLLPAGSCSATRRGNVLTLKSGDTELVYEHPFINISMGSSCQQLIVFVPETAASTLCVSAWVWAPTVVPAFVRSRLHSRSYSSAVRQFQKFCASVAGSRSTTDLGAEVITDGQSTTLFSAHAASASLRDICNSEWTRYTESEKERCASMRRNHWKLQRGAGLGQFEWAKWL